MTAQETCQHLRIGGNGIWECCSDCNVARIYQDGAPSSEWFTTAEVWAWLDNRHIAARDDAALLRVAVEAAENLADYWQPCDKDEARDYCMVHYERHCKGMAVYEDARQALTTILTARPELRGEK